MRLETRLWSVVASVGCISALAGLSLWGPAAHALTISPVLVELSPARRIASITFENPADRPISFQTQALAWSQQDGVDRYDETDELLVVPPIAEIPAGGKQIFRVTMRRPPGAQERAYRLIFENVTEISVPRASDEVAVNILINHNLPVFVSAQGKPRAETRLGGCAARAQPATACVRLDNDGNRYAQVKTLTIESGDWRKEVQVSARVLAGAWRQWTFDVPPTAIGPLKVTAQTRDGPVTTELSLPPR